MNNRIISLLALSLALCWTPVDATWADTTDDTDIDSAEKFSDGELAQILAPVALYPDSLLTHFLVASTYPIEVIEAERWLKDNSELSGNDALEAAQEKDWDPSVKALTPFPRFLSRMSEDLAWTQRVGDAFLQDEARVLATIQDLRKQAADAGSLDKMENLRVEHDDDNIVIAPKEKSVIYVPYYDTRVVYGSWRWSHYEPIHWDWHWAHHHHHHHHGLFYWHPRVLLRDLFFFSAFNWHHHHVVVIRHGHRRGYWNRRQIIRHRHVHRWEHRPVHRRGVAYRHETVRARYRDNRPSRARSRTIRREEARIRSRNRSESRPVTHRREHSKPLAGTREHRIRERLRDQRGAKPRVEAGQRRHQGIRVDKPQMQVRDPRAKPLVTKPARGKEMVRESRPARASEKPRQTRRTRTESRGIVREATARAERKVRSAPTRTRPTRAAPTRVRSESRGRRESRGSRER